MSYILTEETVDTRQASSAFPLWHIWNAFVFTDFGPWDTLYAETTPMGRKSISY